MEKLYNKECAALRVAFEKLEAGQQVKSAPREIYDPLAYLEAAGFAQPDGEVVGVGEKGLHICSILKCRDLPFLGSLPSIRFDGWH
ncbi:unnamed protein product [Durusdinium trenchii]|uniref:Uncharacterized protein n=1 Tax=Durusdinium trenchii TaxID=1381693 RepID=A0ABP0N4W2_9DINO